MWVSWSVCGGAGQVSDFCRWGLTRGMGIRAGIGIRARGDGVVGVVRIGGGDDVSTRSRGRDVDIWVECGIVRL